MVKHITDYSHQHHEKKLHVFTFACLQTPPTINSSFSPLGQKKKLSFSPTVWTTLNMDRKNGKCTLLKLFKKNKCKIKQNVTFIQSEVRGLLNIAEDLFRFKAVTFTMIPNLSHCSPFDNQLMKS